MDSEATKNSIYVKLVYRKDCRGRALSSSIPELNLNKWDRLFPTKSLPDISGFEKMIIPFSVKFWRMTKNDRVCHDCPLITDIPGSSYDLWVVDGLHSWALGGLGSIIAFVFTFCLKSKVFRPAIPFIDPDDQDRLALLSIKALLFAYYKEKKKDPDFKRTGTQAGFKGFCKALEGLVRPLRVLMTSEP